MNKYLLTLSAGVLIATAPAYYAFQAQAEEKPAIAGEVAPSVDCSAIPEGAETPAECVESAADEEALGDAASTTAE